MIIIYFQPPFLLHRCSPFHSFWTTFSFSPLLHLFSTSLPPFTFFQPPFLFLLSSTFSPPLFPLLLFFQPHFLFHLFSTFSPPLFRLLLLFNHLFFFTSSLPLLHLCSAFYFYSTTFSFSPPLHLFSTSVPPSTSYSIFLPTSIISSWNLFCLKSFLKQCLWTNYMQTVAPSNVFYIFLVPLWGSSRIPLKNPNLGLEFEFS